MFKKEMKKVTYEHEVDRMHEKRMEIPRGRSVQPNASLTEAVNEVGNPDRLQCEYNVGKRPETKSIQGLK